MFAQYFGLQNKRGLLIVFVKECQSEVVFHEEGVLWLIG